MSEPVNDDEKIGADERAAGAAKGRKGDYEVGYGRPPKKSRFKKGQSGNPRGRPRGRLSRRALLEKMMNEPVYVREGGKAARKITKYEALLQSHLAKAIKGDTGSAKFVIEEAARSGFGADEDGNTLALPLPRKDSSPQSEALFASLSLDLLSEDDQIELARLGGIIDLGGDFTALSLRDFERAKQIADKGRGIDITPKREGARGE